MNKTSQQENLDSCVRAVWRRKQRLHVYAGVLAFGRWGVLLFLVGMAIDWMTYMPAPGRVVILVTLLAVSIYKAWRCGWRHARSFNATHTALQIEEHHGDLASLLVTAVQFRKAEPVLGTSDSMREMTCRQAEEAIAAVRPEDVVGYHGLRRPFTAMLALALFMSVIGVVNGPFLAVGLARIFPPWMAIAYPTRTQLGEGSGDMIVKEGNPALIQSRVLGVIPREATLELRTGKGKPRLHKLPITDGVCEYSIDSAYRGFEYRVSAGDARSDWHVVEVISSPRIERAKVSLEFPSYTDRPTETVEALTVTVPEGTNIKWKLTLDRAVNKAVYTPAGGETQPLDISPDGQTVTMQQLASESRAYNFAWVDKEHGFSFTSSSHYLQVAPDQSPRVELTLPKSNLYATLGRKLDLAFRGRDDHGIGESIVAYRVNKIAEEKVLFSTPPLGESGEQKIDWDYRETLPDLVIGDTVSFVVELADRYPGPDGPHYARSQARRITFLSKEDYLAQIAKQKQRLLSRLRNIYREERGVHELVRNLDPSSDTFIQTCQLEAVRQDLMRERLGVLKDRMQDLIDDLAANHIDETESATLVRLGTDIQTIAQTFVGRAAASLRDLASPSGTPDPKAAVDGVDNAARELGCIVLQMGFREATEVMARELHAISQTQAHLRLQSMMSKDADSDTIESLTHAQDQLALWLIRLFAAIPQDKESTIDDALVAFNLSRLIKELRNVGVDTKMLEAVSLVRTAALDGAARLQADVIRALLRAEFRLRIGAEHEALGKASDLFMAQIHAQQKLRVDIAGLTSQQFNQRLVELGQAQAALHLKLQLLLMPAIPAPRAHLFDVDLPAPPPAEALLAQAEEAMEKAVASIAAGDRGTAAIQQQRVETSFAALNTIVDERIDALSERERVTNLIRIAGTRVMDVDQLTERQLNLLELTEDAFDDESDAVQLAQLEQKLADDVETFRLEIVAANKDLAIPSQDGLPLLSHLEKTVAAMVNAVPSLKGNQLEQAIEHQETAVEALEHATNLIEQRTVNMASLKAILDDTRIALMPVPYVADIRSEQLDMVVETREASADELPKIAIVQKNLVHAVNAVLNSLEALSHQVEAGTVMLFAKDDMDAAATALEINDLAEAADAQTYVAESLQDLLVEIQTVTPQYSYILEVSEFFNEIITQGLVIQASQNQLREKLQAADDALLDELIRQQRALEANAETYSSQLYKATGLKSYGVSSAAMAAALAQLEAGDREAALEQLEQVNDTLSANTNKMLNLMELLSNVLKPPPGPAHSPEALLVLDVLALASHQKVLYRQTQPSTPEQAAEFAAKQLELAERGEELINGIEAHAKAHMLNATSTLKAEYARNGGAGKTIPLTQAINNQQQSLQRFFTDARVNIVAANKSMMEAATQLEGAATSKAIASQHRAGEQLRYFLLKYINALLVPPGPPAPSDPAITDPTESFDDDLTLFSPGAVSGGKPKGERVEWQVLGRRDRAALNENFARELPLEFRAILKDYYERLAR